jgi:choline dehydrogenase
MRFPSRYNPSMAPSAADYVIVGAGSAGCVLADRLSADGRRSVLLLEAGPPDAYPWLHIPIGYAKTMFNPEVNWCFYTEPEAEMHGRKIYWPRGKTLGGSSSINGLIAIRGQREDYDAWAAAGNDDWGYREVLPYFKRLEHALEGDAAFHGFSGPMWCSPIGRKHELIEAVIAGCAELGIPRNDDFNGSRQEGAGYYQLTTRRGWRCSTASAYLKPARRRGNLRVETGAQVTRVAFERRRAVGVVYRKAGSDFTVTARREVLLCAGAVQTPQLLQLSGVGPRALLAAFDIPLVHELPGVGENLQDHLQVRVIFECTRPITTNDDLKSGWRMLRMGLDYLITRGGPMAVGINQGGIFARVDPAQSTPDVQFHVATLSSDMAGSPPHAFSGFTMSVCQLRPEARGFVRIRSADPLQPPAMQPTYLSTDKDRRTLVAGIKLARRLAATRALAPYIHNEYRPGSAVTSDEDLLDFARATGGTIFHPSGTCKMGSDTLAVVDPVLRVRGVEQLRVVDCSVMPTLTSGNTNLPVIMIAEKAADLILRENPP